MINILICQISCCFITIAKQCKTNKLDIQRQFKFLSKPMWGTDDSVKHAQTKGARDPHQC